VTGELLQEFARRDVLPQERQLFGAVADLLAKKDTTFAVSGTPQKRHTPQQPAAKVVTTPSATTAVRDPMFKTIPERRTSTTPVGPPCNLGHRD